MAALCAGFPSRARARRAHDAARARARATDAKDGKICRDMRTR